MHWLPSRWRYSNVMSTIAVFIALGGASYAATQLPKNSVGTKQIKNGQVKHADIGKNAVTSTDVKNGSLLSADFKAGQLVAGAAGPQGLKGADGAQGPKGVAGSPGRSALTPLGADETVRGVVGLDAEAPAATGDYRATASYPIPLSAVPAAFIVGDTPGSEVCTGTLTDPTAPAGTLCIYPAQAFNPDLGTNHHAVFTTAGKYGFRVSWSVSGSGDTYFYGSYAVTGV
jgi:hypothetical protein